jgi:hypothetical protein
MPTINGIINISFTPGSEDNTINYSINGVPAAPINVSCLLTIPPTPCTVSLPIISYDYPSCDELIIEGVVSPDCDPSIQIPFSKVFDLTQDCRNWKVTCIRDSGCKGFDSTGICPECVINEQISYNGGFIDTFSNDPNYASDPPLFILNQGNNFIPGNTEFNLCLSEPYTLAQSLDPDFWKIELNSNPDTCCYECEVLEISFSRDELAAGPRFYPDFYPTIYYTTCDDGCYRIKKLVYYNLSMSNTITACVRKGSLTIMGNKFPYNINVLSTCSL